MKPMLAEDIDITNIDSLPYPLYGSRKEDGIRCLSYKDNPLTRSFEPIPNLYVRRILKSYCKELRDFDGELKSGVNFQETTSAIMSHDGEPEFTYFIFDKIGDGCYEDRFLARAKPKLPFTEVLVQYFIETPSQLKALFKSCIKEGYEGCVFRRADGLDKYKFGRSTLKQAFLLRLVEYATDEAIIIGLKEGEHNTNVLGVDNLGYAKRSSSKIGKVPNGTLGAFIVESKKFGIFNIGTGDGLDDELRLYIWNHQSDYIGGLLKYKYKVFGIKDKPRQPIFVGFRDERDC